MLLRSVDGLQPVGEVLRAIRKQPRPGRPKGVSITEAAKRTELLPEGEGVSVRTWSRVEHGHSHPKAQSLLCMALAIEATSAQFRDLFRAAGYGLLFDALSSFSSSGIRRARPGRADVAIMSDPSLPYEKRRLLADLWRDMLQADEARRGGEKGS